MNISHKIRDEKLQHYVNREITKINIIFWKIDIYEYLTAEEVLRPDRSQIIKQAKHTYSLLGKALEKQTKYRLML